MISHKKYKERYLHLKRQGRHSKFDIYFFFDLLDSGEQVLARTTEDDFILLIGETPAYLRPFLEDEREIMNLPFSDKPFGCFLPPFGLTNKEMVDEGYSKELFNLPDLHLKSDLLNQYYNYLDKNTPLTREYLKDNWNKIVAIDYSSGITIHGLSIFLNRYAGNIGIDNECTDVEGAKPLKFISLGREIFNKTNIDPQIAKSVLTLNDLNYNPRLIIHLGEVKFGAYRDFLFSGYPRYVPFYPPFIWNTEPEYSSTHLKKGLKTISYIKSFYVMYKNFISNRADYMPLLQELKKLPNYDTKDMIRLNVLSAANPELGEKLLGFLKDINGKVLAKKS